MCGTFGPQSSRVEGICPQTSTRGGIYSIRGGLWHLVDICGQMPSTPLLPKFKAIHIQFDYGLHARADIPFGVQSTPKH